MVMVMVQVRVNGDVMDIEDGSTLGALLTQLGLGAKWVLVERNGEPVPRPEVPTVVLQGGDRLELVRAVAGG
jgi:thiamine biosynthesis protein ThiS